MGYFTLATFPQVCNFDNIDLDSSEAEIMS
jgi:hypothetical protein